MKHREVYDNRGLAILGYAMLFLAMPPWIERDQPTPFDDFAIKGRRDLDGDMTALKYHQTWVEGKKYPLIQFPSEVEREITIGKGEQSVTNQDVV